LETVTSCPSMVRISCSLLVAIGPMCLCYGGCPREPGLEVAK
jgi:hypothetical protein